MKIISDFSNKKVPVVRRVTFLPKELPKGWIEDDGVSAQKAIDKSHADGEKQWAEWAAEADALNAKLLGS